MALCISSHAVTLDPVSGRHESCCIITLPSINQSIFGVVTLYIYRSTYELFKYYLMEPSKDASPHSKEDTIDDMRVAQQRHLGRSGAEISNTESDKKDTRLWDQIVTDLPIQVQVVRAESSVNTDLVVRDRTFPGYRT